MQFTGKTVLVTGGTSGIGRETAKAYAERGADVIITGRDAERGQQLIAEIKDTGHPAHFIPADLSSHADLTRLVQQSGPVGILVNDAGCWEFAPTHQTSESAFDQMFSVNVKAPFFLTAAYAPQMAANGGGAIVNVSSMVGSRGRPGAAAYGASKAALELLTRAWAAEYGPQGVRVNAVALGPTRTRAMADVPADVTEAETATVPLRRTAEPAEIAQAIIYLTSEASAYITGAVVPVDGGRTAAL